MISMHKDRNNLYKPQLFSKDWIVCTNDTIEVLQHVATNYAVSPIEWSGGVRKGCNFFAADWLALDIDNGMSIEEAKKFFWEYKIVIGTTKSHGKKGKNDRYRVFIPFEHTIDCQYIYKGTLKIFIEATEADEACLDLARFFWPCKEIVHVQTKGKSAEVYDDPELIWGETNENEEKIASIEHLRTIHANGSFPPWIHLALEHGYPGQVNNMCFRIGLCLGTLGYGKKEIVRIIWNSNLPNKKSGKQYETIKKEISLAVGNGVRTAEININNCADPELMHASGRKSRYG